MSEIRVDTISEKTSANGVAVDGVTLKDGGAALTGNLTIDDDSQISLGASADLVIRHNAANGNSFITDAGTGGLFIQANSTLALQSQGTSENFLVGTSDGSVKLFHNGNEKLETTADGVHIKIADSGATATAHGDELVIEDGTSGANVGISILSNANGEARINFGDSDDNDIGGIYYEHVGDRMEFVVNNAVGLNIINGPKLATYNETAPDVDQGGLCLNQGGDDGNILTFKSSDVAHARTGVAETDTYAEFKKAGQNDGGLHLTTINDAGNVSFYVDSHARTFDTGKGTGDHGCINLDANKHDGSNGGETITSNGNMVTISNDNSVRFIFDAEGDFHADSSSTTFDSYEDAQLVRAYDLSHGKGVIASQFDKFVQYNTGDLTDAGLVGRITSKYNKDGTKANPLINMSGFMRLHNGAIWQQYEKHQNLAKAVYELAKVAVGEDKANEILEQNEIKLLN